MTDVTLCQVKLVTGDFDEALRFYRCLGLTFDVDGDHACADAGKGIRLEIDSAELVSDWDANWNEQNRSGAILGFSVTTECEVDTVYDALLAGGFVAHLEPYDAPWGKRVAIIDDPDGNPVAVIGPIHDLDWTGGESPPDGGERQIQ